MIHLVMNPRKGGSPPKERKFKKIINMINLEDLIR